MKWRTITSIMPLYTPLPCFYLFKLIFTGVQLLYYVKFLPYSKAQLYIYIYPLFGVFFPFRSPQSTAQFPELHSRFSLVIYFIHSINSVHMLIAISQFIPPSPLGVQTFVLYICVSISALQITQFLNITDPGIFSYIH